MISKPTRKGFLQYLGFKHHEYWSWWLLVIPVWPLWIWYALRLRCITWFTVVNPGMEDGGFLGESKIKILDSIPTAFKPLTLFMPNSTLSEEMLSQVSKLGFSFPLICKPDIGGRGRKVKIVQHEGELLQYHEEVSEDYIIQNLIPYELEFGVFYVRLPNEEKGKVTSLSQKLFLRVVGDGIQTLQQLMEKDYRASLQIVRLSAEVDMQQVLMNKEEFLLEPIGNHCRGTAFLDAQNLINEQLHQVFDMISKQIPGFYYGRYDIRVKSLSDLYEGQHIQIMELNGLTADATHIFDPNARLRDAYLTQIRNCNLSYQIAKQHLKNGVRATPLSELLSKSFAYLRENG